MFLSTQVYLSHNVSEPVCMNEITVFLACMKKQDFVDAACLVEHSTYMNCIARENAKQVQLKEAAKQGLLGSGERKMSSQQVRYIYIRQKSPTEWISAGWDCGKG